MEFWKSAGMHLVEKGPNGWLTVTPDYLRAYFTRPEIHPIDESCPAEHALFEKLMQDPFCAVTKSDITKIVDQDAADNYRVILRFRDHLAKHKTIEASYAALFQGETIAIPPVFINQMVHLVLCNIMEGTTDPMRLRAAELFFREQIITMGEEQLMLADEEIVEMQSASGFGGLGQLLAEAGTPMREVALDVLTEDNKDIYWQRSDKFDVAIDFRFTQPAPDAFGRVIEAWIYHFLKVKTRIEAVKSIRDEKWSWHVGCDVDSTRILNALYNGDDVDENELIKILSLYRLEFIDQEDAKENMRGKPIYLAVAMSDDKKLICKPQNLLTNLPLSRD